MRITKQPSRHVERIRRREPRDSGGFRSARYKHDVVFANFATLRYIEGLGRFAISYVGEIQVFNVAKLNGYTDDRLKYASDIYVLEQLWRESDLQDQL